MGGAEREGGRGGASLAPAYITVAVGNRIHQIKSSIYLCGSGDSVVRVVGVLRWEGWPKGERVTLTLQTERGGGGDREGWQRPVASVLKPDIPAPSSRVTVQERPSSPHMTFILKRQCLLLK